MSTGKQKFGPWLLGQVERDDAIGSMALAWKKLKEASGYNRVTTAKSIGQLISARLGEDWVRLHGDEVIAAAEKEWDRYLAAADSQPAEGEQGTIFDLPQVPNPPAPPAPVQTPPMVTLVVDGHEFELTPGQRYVLRMTPAIHPDPVTEQQAAAVHAQRNAMPMIDPDRLDWNALYGHADHNLPEGADLATLGLAEE